MVKNQTLLSESRVKEILGIDDFRHMTKDGAIEFVSMMSQMEPEVALKAIEQFPELTRTAISWMTDFKETMIHEINVNAERSKLILDSLESSIDCLNARLKRENLTTEDLTAIIDGICRLQEMKLQLHAKDQKHGIDVLKIGLLALATIGGIVLCGLGASGRIKIPSFKK